MKGTLTYNERRDRAEITFPGKPGATTRATLKASGWWWDREGHVWYLARPAVVDSRGNPIGDPRAAAVEAVMPFVDCDIAAYRAAEDAAGHRAGARGMEIALGIA
jgi:hypothetical protein